MQISWTGTGPIYPFALGIAELHKFNSKENVHMQTFLQVKKIHHVASIKYLSFICYYWNKCVFTRVFNWHPHAILGTI